MSFQAGIGTLGGTVFFQVGLCTPLRTVTALRLLKFLILKKRPHHFLTTFKVINAEKRLHHFLTTLIVFNTGKGNHHCLKVFNTEKGLHHSLETLKSFNFEKWLHQILMTLKYFQNSYSAECWWTAASEGRLSYHIYD